MTKTDVPQADPVRFDEEWQLDALLAFAPATGELPLKSLADRIVAEALAQPRIVADNRPIHLPLSAARAIKPPVRRSYWPEAAVLAASLFAGVGFGLSDRVGTYLDQLAEASGLTEQQVSVSAQDLFGGHPQTEGLL